jgi:hypothetical protein
MKDKKVPSTRIENKFLLLMMAEREMEDWEEKEKENSVWIIFNNGCSMFGMKE